MQRISAIFRFGAKLSFRVAQFRCVSTETSRYDKFFGPPVKFGKTSNRRNPLFDFIESHPTEESIDKLRDLSKNGEIKLSPGLGVYLYRNIMTSPDKFDDAIKILSDPTIGINFPVKESINSILDITFNVSPDRVIDIVKLNPTIPKQYYIDFNSDVINRTHGRINYISDINEIYHDIEMIHEEHIENKPSEFSKELPRKLKERVEKRNVLDDTKLNEKEQILALDNIIKKDRLLNVKSDDDDRLIKIKEIGNQLDKIQESIRKQSLYILYSITKYVPGSTIPIEPIDKPIGRITKHIDSDKQKKIVNAFTAPELYEIYTQQLQNNYIARNVKFEDTYKKYAELYNQSSNIEIINNTIKINEDKFDTPINDNIKNLENLTVNEQMDRSNITSGANFNDIPIEDYEKMSENESSTNSTDKSYCDISDNDNNVDFKSGINENPGRPIDLTTSDKSTRGRYIHQKDSSPNTNVQDLDMSDQTLYSRSHDIVTPVSTSINNNIEMESSTHINNSLNGNIDHSESVNINHLQNGSEAPENHPNPNPDHSSTTHINETVHNPFPLNNNDSNYSNHDTNNSREFYTPTSRSADNQDIYEGEKPKNQYAPKEGKASKYISSIKTWITTNKYSTGIKRLITLIKDRYFHEKEDDNKSPYTMDQCIKIVADHVLDPEQKEIYDFLKEGGLDLLSRETIEDRRKAQYVLLIKNIAQTFYIYSKSDSIRKEEIMNDLLDDTNLNELNFSENEANNNNNSNQTIQSQQLTDQSTNYHGNYTNYDSLPQKREGIETPEYLKSKRSDTNKNEHDSKKQYKLLSKAINDTIENEYLDIEAKLPEKLKHNLAQVLSNSGAPIYNYNKPTNPRHNPDELSQEINMFQEEVDQEFPDQNTHKKQNMGKHFNKPVDYKLIDEVFERIDRIFDRYTHSGNDRKSKDDSNSNKGTDSKNARKSHLLDPSLPEDAVIKISLDDYKDKLHEIGIDSDEYNHFDTFDARDFAMQEQGNFASTFGDNQMDLDPSELLKGCGNIPPKLDQYLKNLKDPEDKPSYDYNINDLQKLASELMGQL